jgi:hypothetical protein
MTESILLGLHAAKALAVVGCDDVVPPEHTISIFIYQ